MPSDLRAFRRVPLTGEFQVAGQHPVDGTSGLALPHAEWSATPECCKVRQMKAARQ